MTKSYKAKTYLNNYSALAGLNVPNATITFCSWQSQYSSIGLSDPDTIAHFLPQIRRAKDKGSSLLSMPKNNGGVARSKDLYGWEIYRELS